MFPLDPADDTNPVAMLTAPDCPLRAVPDRKDTMPLLPPDVWLPVYSDMYPEFPDLLVPLKISNEPLLP